MLKFFTQRTQRPSLRLRVLSHGFDLWGCLSVTTLLAAVWQVYGSHRIPVVDRVMWLLTGQWFNRELPVSQAISMFSLLAIQAASFFIIAHALRKRRRWGAYLAGFTAGAPLAQQLMSPWAPLMTIPQIAATTVSLCVMVTVWDELRSLRDDDFADDAPLRNFTAAVTPSHSLGTPLPSQTFGTPLAGLERTAQLPHAESHESVPTTPQRNHEHLTMPTL